MRETEGNPTLSTARIEAFSDGVFAIAITLLILEIKIPSLPKPGVGIPPGTATRLTTALLQQWPAYTAYILTFVMIGIYWANHHYIFHLYKRTNHVFNLLNVLFLMFISIMPFPTAILGQYFNNASEQRTAMVLYTIGMLLPAIFWFVMWCYASHNYRLIDRRLAPEFVQDLTRQYLISNALYATAVIVSFVNPVAGLIISMGLTIIYLLPPKRPVYRSVD